MSYLIGKALGFALDAHRDQTDKAGRCYLIHLLDVARQADSDEECIVALLHDFIEDAPNAVVREERQRLLTDTFDEKICHAILAISKREDESREDYLRRLKKDPLAKAVKYMDHNSNTNEARLAELAPETRGRLVKKYKHDLEILNAED